MIQGQLLSSVNMAWGGGEAGVVDGWGSAAQFSESSKIGLRIHSHDEFWLKPTHCWIFSVYFSQINPCLRKMCRKWPLLENFGPKTHQYREHIPVSSTCYVFPPPPHQQHPTPSWPLAFTSKNSTNIQPTSMGQPYPHDGLPALRELMWAGYWVHVNAWRDFAGEGPTICTCREGPKFVDIYVIRGAC